MRDEFVQIGHIGPALELERDFAWTREPKLEFCVEIKRTCGLYWERLDLREGQRGEVLLLPRDALDLDGNDPL